MVCRLCCTMLSVSRAASSLFWFPRLPLAGSNLSSSSELVLEPSVWLAGPISSYLGAEVGLFLGGAACMST